MNIILYAVPFFFLLIFIELLLEKNKGTDYYRVNDSINSLTAGVLSRMTGIIKQLFPLTIYVVAYDHLAMFQMESSWWIWVIAFVLYDFCYYWKHRLGHEMNIFWAAHVVHHSSEEYNLTTALRQSGSSFLSWIFYLPMAVLGFEPIVLITVGSLNLIYQFWVHTEHIGHLGFLEKIFITPMNHGIHHAKNKEYIDANYGGVFIIWDRMFGTYTARLADVTPVYGTVSALKSFNPIWANTQVYTNMIKDTIKTKKLSDKIKIWYSRTYWRPEDCIEEKDPKEFYIKYDPIITSDIKVFSFFQMLFTIIVSGSVLFFLAQFSYNEIIAFAVSITLLSSLTATLLQGKRYMYAVIVGFSILGIFSIEFFGIFNHSSCSYD